MLKQCSSSATLADQQRRPFVNDILSHSEVMFCEELDEGSVPTSLVASDDTSFSDSMDSRMTAEQWGCIAVASHVPSCLAA